MPKSARATAMPPASPGNHAARIAGSRSCAQRDRERTGVEEHECDPGVRREHGFEQRLLRAREVQVAAVASFGFDPQAGAEAEHHDVRLFRQRHRAGHGAGVGRTDEARALLVVDRDVGAEHLAQALHDADLAGRRAVVVAGRVVLVAGRAITAIDRVSSRFSGRNATAGLAGAVPGPLLRLLRSVSDFCATCSDRARWSGLRTTLIGIASYGVDGSKAPSRNPTRSTFDSARSTSATVSRPRCTALGMLSSNS